MTPIEIIDETVKWYGSNPERRAIIRKRGQNPSPRIRLLSGMSCAFGRVMNTLGLKTYGKHEGAADSIFDAARLEFECDVNFGSPQWFLKQEYRGWSPQFWFDLQKLHDRDEFWTSQGLAVQGCDYVDHLKRKFKDPEQWRAAEFSSTPAHGV